MSENGRPGKIKYQTVQPPTTELLKALNSLEKLKELNVIKQNRSLNEPLTKLQTLFTSTLSDYLAVGSSGLTPIEMGFARTNDRYGAMKLVRERTGCGMKEAKEMVEKWQRENGINPCGGQR